MLIFPKLFWQYQWNEEVTEVEIKLLKQILVNVLRQLISVTVDDQMIQVAISQSIAEAPKEWNSKLQKK